MTHEPASVLVQIDLAAAPDEVWRALREPERLKQWFGWDADSLDEEIRYIFQDQAHPDAASRRLRFEPWEGKADAFELSPLEGGARLAVVRTGAAPDTDWDAVFDDLREGWTSFVHQLKLALEVHPGERRRTLYLTGRPVAAPARAALGLAALPRSGEVGLAQAPGGPLRGQVWRQGAFQTIVRIADWNDGLLAVIDRPGGGSQATLTTYGLDAGAFAALEAAWRDWWERRFEPS